MGANRWYTLDFPTIEMYFDEPLAVINTFWVGASSQTNILQWLYDRSGYNFGVMACADPSMPGCEYLGYHIGNVPENPSHYSSFSNPNLPLLQQGHFSSITNYTLAPGVNPPAPCQLLWGGPFAIVAPAPCMKPHDLRVEMVHYDSAIVRWEVPVRVSFSRLEYGPQGFALGTGTVIDCIIGGECHIGGLAENTTYDVYVTGWCVAHDCYSDYSDTVIATPEACMTKTRIGETRVTDTSVYVEWYPAVEVSYSEVLFGPFGFAEGDGVMYGPIYPDSTWRCSLQVEGM